MDTNKFNFFILLLTLITYNQLFYSPFLAEARNSSSGGQTYIIDLIHRDSQSFSRYNPSTTTNDNKKRPILGSISYNHNFHLSSKHYGHSTTIGTEAIPNGGDYLMKIAIGTPPVELTAVADTGSDLVWFQCTPCQQCIQQQEPLFSPKKSSSYKSMPCNSHSCNYTDMESTCIPNNKNDHGLCVYKVEYGDGTSSIGILSIDKVTFTSSHTHSVTVPSVTFGCGFNQEGNFGINGDGIIGLGTGNLSLMSQLGPTINHKFTYCLTPLSSGVNGKLKLGPNKKVPGYVSTPMVNSDDGFYTLELKGATVGKSSIKVDQNVIIDSGTTYTYLESSIYDSIKNSMKKAIKLKPVSDPYELLEPCYKEEETKKGFNPPDVVFHFKGADIVLKTINTFRTRANVTCLAMVPVIGISIFGNIAQVNFEVEYDLEGRQVSFAPTDCTKY